VKHDRIRYVLDTDTITAHQRNDGAVILAFTQVSPDTVATTIVTMYEQLRGRLAIVNRDMADLAKLPLAYKRLTETAEYYSRIPVLPFTEAASQEYAQLLRRRLRGPSKQDLQIAAIALAHGAVVVTRNTHHFSLITQLKSVDWMS